MIGSTVRRVMRTGSRTLAADRGFGREALGTVVPQGVGGWAFELGPDLLAAGAATAFAGPAAGLEEGVLGIGGSFGGRFAGSSLAYGLARLQGKSPRVMRQMVQQGAGMGGLAGGLGLSYFGPRPLTDAARRQQEEELLKQQAVQDNPLLSGAVTAPQWQNYNALLSSLGGG